MADPLDNANLLKAGTVGTGTSGVVPDSGAAMGKALGNVGQRGFNLAQKAQEADNAAKMSDMRRSLREHAAEVERSMIDDPTGDSWLDTWDQQMDSFSGQWMASENLSPNVRAEMEIYLNDFRSKGSQDIQTKAMVRKFERAEQSGLMEAEDALARGDLDGYNSAIRSIPGKLPEWQDRMESEGAKKFDLNNLEAQVLNDPFGEPADLPEWMPSGKQAQMRKKFESGRDGLMADSAQDLADKVEGDFITDAEVIRDMVENDPILENAPESYRKTLTRNLLENTPLTSDELASNRAMIRELREMKQDPTVTEEEYEKAFNARSNQLAVLGNRQGAKQLRQEMGGHSPANVEENARRTAKGYTERAIDATFRQFDAERLEVTDPDKKATMSEVHNLVEDEVKARAEAYGYENIRNFDLSREPNSPTWTERAARDVRSQLDFRKNAAGALDIVFPEGGDEPHPLLPSKNAGNLLGEQ